MVEQHITDAKDLVAQVSALGEAMRERRRHERQSLLWAATIEVNGSRFEGMIMDLSPGGARLRFDAAVSQGDELSLVLKELNGLGARVVWQREGEAGIQFMLAPDEVTARVESKTGVDLRRPSKAKLPLPRPWPVREPEASPKSGRGKLYLVSIAGALAAVVSVAVFAGGAAEGEGTVREVFAVTGGAADQHNCANRMDKLANSSNQIDFSLNVASAVQSKCLSLKQLNGNETDPRGHMVQATKVPVH